MMIRYLKDILKKPRKPEVSFGWRDSFFFLHFARPVWKMGAASILLTLMATALNSLLPLGSKVLIDFVILKKESPRLVQVLAALHLPIDAEVIGQSLQSITVLVAAMLAIGVSVGILEMLHQYLNLRFQQEVTFNLQTTLFDHLLRFPLSFFKKGQTGYLVSRASDDVNALRFLFSQSLTRIIRNVFYLVFGVAILFTLSVKLAVISVILLPIYLIINYFFAGRQRSVSLDERERSAQVSREMTEIISGVEVIKAHTSEEREVKKVSERLRSVINTRIRARVLSMASGYAVRSAQYVTTLLIMLFGAGEIQSGSMSIGDYVAFTTYVVYLSGSVRSLSLFNIMMQPFLASLDRLNEIFQTVSEFDPGSGEGGKRLDRVRGEIRFEQVTFGYEQGLPVLENVNLFVQPGEVIALTGASGVGKTTLVNLLLKFYKPETGDILLDGVSYRELDTRWLRGQLGIVSQDVFLFNDTIENNIRYGRPEAGRDAVIQAARNARIHDEIESFRDGYATVVGERGVNLSAGQRQRISVARAFLKDPAILIFDEPTSALDDTTERLLKDSIQTLVKDRTTIIISHRESVVDVAQKVIEIKRGRCLIVE